MRRHIILTIVALLLSPLCACTGLEIRYEETPSVLADLASPIDTPSEQDADVLDPQASGMEQTWDDASADAAEENTSEFVSQPPSSASQEETVSDAHEDKQTEDENSSMTADSAESLLPDADAGQEAPTTAETGEQPPLLTQCVESAGLCFDDFEFSQLILVSADASHADIYCYDRDVNGLWTLNGDLGYIAGYAGRKGVSTDKREGDERSPGGLFRLGYAFGNKPKPQTGMEYRAITEDTYWIDDPGSRYYNQWVEGTDGADWTSGEHLADNVVSYAYAVAIEYNTPPDTIAGKGSAIFIHIGNKPTSGCITVTEETLLRMLKWLSSDQNPYILIVSGNSV